jgi:23S rRNA (cytidine1920-2'-O)/16S rRNA (cytidine1409-2'-O)-methyltransferase
MARRRVDVLVVEQGLAPNRSRARALILAGSVIGEGDRRLDKPGEMIAETTELRLRGEPLPYVSRGGLKLEAALDRFGVDVTGAVCLDVGASTGGFTDCLLQRGARRVYAVDVGYGQLAWSLRQDPRVVVIERANIRHLEADRIPERCERIVIDVSFISLAKVLPAALRFAAEGAILVALVKPQFEVGRDAVGKGGIVRDDAAREAALRGVVEVVDGLGGTEVESMDSPITGAKGNRELLVKAYYAKPLTGL